MNKQKHWGDMVKELVRSLARHFGYEVRKAPFSGFHAAPIFDLAVQCLMAIRGEALTFIQVGANDGKFGDPLRKYILKYGWTGVLIEPQPEVFEKLKQNYVGLENRLFFENVAISSSARKISLYRAPLTNQQIGSAADYAASVASSNQDVVARQLGIRRRELEEVIVPAVRLDELISKYHLRDLAILQIDTEGYDWEVLQTLDLAAVKPVIVQFEHGHLSPHEIGMITKYLNTHHYLVYFGGHESDSVAMSRELFTMIR